MFDAFLKSCLLLMVTASMSIVQAENDTEAETEIIALGDSRIVLLIEDKPFDLERVVLRDWVVRSAEIVAQYYGGFPVEEAYVAVRGRRGGRVMTGRAFGSEAGGVVNVSVGLLATQEALDADWVLIHELIHLAFPTMPRRHHWIEEGISVYVESIARANSGDLTPQAVWLGFLDGMPKGLPRNGDKGLDHTPTWGRTYWGGALFCLLADVRIRQQTDGQRSLRDGLRGIVAAGYDITRSSELRPVLQAADKATGVTVLTELYDEMRAQPEPSGLDVLWLELGVSEESGEVIFTDDAPLGAIRDALTARDL